MQTPCKNCKALSHSDFPAAKTTTLFIDGVPSGGNEKWLCFRCETEICVNCYWYHTSKSHPEVYSCKCQTCKQMTFVDDFRDYKWCVKCLPEKEQDENQV